MEEMTRELFPGVRLTTIRTDRFHSGHFSLHLLRPLRAADASRNALLPSVLCRGTRTLPDQAKISDALDNLYGSSLEPGIRQMGECLAIGFQAAFPDDRFLPGAADCLRSIVSMSCEMLLDPATRGGLLRDDYVRSEGQNLHDRIKAAVNNKRGYARKRARELMFEGEAFGVYPLGEAEDALRIRYQALTKYYREALRTSPLELFYCGSAGHERVEDAVRREILEETGMTVDHMKFNRSQYFERSDTLMCNFTAYVKSAEDMHANYEIDSYKWFSREEAAKNIRPGSLAEHFLVSYLGEPDVGARVFEEPGKWEPSEVK